METNDTLLLLLSIGGDEMGLLKKYLLLLYHLSVRGYLDKALSVAILPDDSIRDKVKDDVSTSLFRCCPLTRRKRNIVDSIIQKYEKDYIDPRNFLKTGQYPPARNFEFAKQSIRSHINSGNFNLFLIEVDGDGVKFVNDTWDHQNGNVYLSKTWTCINIAIENVQAYINAYYRGTCAHLRIEDEVDIFPIAKSGDEFSIVGVAKKGGRINLSESYFPATANSSEAAALRIDELLKLELHDQMFLMDCSDFADREAMIIAFADSEMDLAKDCIEKIINAKSKIDHFFVGFAERFKVDLLAQNFNEAKLGLIDAVTEHQTAIIEKVAREYSDYDFFASASCGSLVMNPDFFNLQRSLEYLADKLQKEQSISRFEAFRRAQEIIGTPMEWREKEIFQKKIEYFMRTNEISLEFATFKALFDLFLKQTDWNMSADKTIFKEQMRLAGNLENAKKIDVKKCRNLFLHIKALSRSNEQKAQLVLNKKLEDQNTGFRQVIDDQDKRLSSAMAEIDKLNFLLNVVCNHVAKGWDELQTADQVTKETLIGVFEKVQTEIGKSCQ